jgi:enterochelin esterase-like enzyme
MFVAKQKAMRKIRLGILLLFTTVTAFSQTPLDKAPEGFDVLNQRIAHGKITTVEYPSQTVDTLRKVNIYTPPGYSSQQQYPVLYLLHGIGGDEREWIRNGAPLAILDNLYASGKLKPMIVVLPNGRATKHDKAEGDLFAPEKVQAFSTFEKDLLNDLMPFIESHYPVLKGPDNTALAGLSMGGGQSLNFGLAHLDVFGWIGGFSSAPNTKEPHDLLPEPSKAKVLKLLWISCGDLDNLLEISTRTHVYLEGAGIPHQFMVESGKHDFLVWKNDLYHFSQLLFK